MPNSALKRKRRKVRTKKVHVQNPASWDVTTVGEPASQAGTSRIPTGPRKGGKCPKPASSSAEGGSECECTPQAGRSRTPTYVKQAQFTAPLSKIPARKGERLGGIKHDNSTAQFTACEPRQKPFFFLELHECVNIRLASICHRHTVGNGEKEGSFPPPAILSAQLAHNRKEHPPVSAWAKELKVLGEEMEREKMRADCAGSSNKGSDTDR
ncbi:hypothetical protein HPB48_000042 [Haemaphysalis longicornis]|uniref:Uncharacterized protein n=1 Tax=Haemaphysalis longicornis TaxID=44386 RepID=A0A9J6FU37_HAELO|nr:hypothetical protein HPB48_000042 [Haemaphysalis longicornis]